MYEDFFGLTERPFDLTPSPKFLVLTESHREALRNLEYGIGSRKGITLLLGDAGAGKTTVIRAAIDKLPTHVHTVHISNPTLSRPEFVETLAAKFGLSSAASLSKASMLAELEGLLMRRRAAGESSVMILDEAQSLPLDLLEEVRLLANIETDSEKLLSVIIAGQPELATRLNQPELRQLKQRVALRCELRPLTRAETEAYIAGRIRAAGGIGARIFTREAVAVIHDGAQGLPRTVNVIADNALLGGFAAGRKPVGTDIVMDVCRDFDLAAAGGPSSEMLPGRQLDGPVAPRLKPARTDMAGAQMIEGPASATGDGAFGAFSAKRKRFSFFWN
jgi:general secretion pathway protein A